MGRSRAFVLGWYGHGNLGDEAFKTSFLNLFPQVDFTFGDRVPRNVNSYDFMWVGGGSFMDQAVPNPYSVDIKVPIAYIGVGLGSNVHPTHRALLDAARLVVVRNLKSKQYCEKAIVCPDLAFAMPNEQFQHRPVGKKVTILLNDFVSPRSNSPDWMYLAYYWFCAEFGTVCNDLVKDGYTLKFVPMGTGDIDDRRIAAQIVGRITKKANVIWQLEPATEVQLRTDICESDFVITQRFHGIVFSAISSVPFVSIRNHDKMLTLNEEIGWHAHLDYYGFNKNYFSRALNQLTVDKVDLLKSFTKNALEQWKCMSSIVVERFSL